MNRRLHRIYAYMGAGLLLAGGLLFSITIFAANRQNEQSRATQQEIVRFETQHLFEALSGKLSPMIYWQEAYDNVASGWDQKWVSYQFGPYLDSLDVNTALVFDQNFSLKHHYSRDLKTPPRPQGITGSPTLKALYTRALAARSQAPPVIEQGVVIVDGQPYFASAGQIAPEDEKLLPVARDRQRVVMFLDHITAADYATLAGGFGVANIQIDQADLSSKGFASVPFTANDGTVVTRLWWAPQRPGHSFISFVIPLSIVVIAALAGLQFLVLRRFQSLSSAVLRAEAKAEAAQEESAAKSAFLGTISHELRTPLNAIIGFADMLGQNIFGPLGSPRYEEYVRHIRTSGHSLLHTINDVIEISRIEAGDTAVESCPTDLKDALEEALLMVLAKADARGIRLHMEHENTDHVWCLASPISLMHVIARVLDNAVKFSLDNGAIEIALTSSRHTVSLEIRDYGIGISPDKLEFLGRPFVQGEGHMVRSHAGIGLGLAISRGLMNAMGGQLSIQSQEGIGTIVTLTLAGAAAPAHARTREKAAA